MVARRRWTGWFVLLLLAGVAQAKETPKPTIEFLSVEQAAAAIADESLEPYFSLLQPAEMEAKTGGRPLEGDDLEAQRAACRERYRRGVRAFSEDEQRALRTYVERLHAKWAATYPRLADLPWSFLGTDDVVEGGLPHTRGRSIVIPRSVATALAASLALAEPHQRANLDLLVHEQAHVLQRLEPDLFVPLYTAWGFVRADGLRPAANVLPRHVVNPDGVRTEWVFPVKEGGQAVWLHPLVVLHDAERPHRMPHELEMIAVEMGKKGAAFVPKEGPDGEPVVRPLQEVRAYGEHFGGIFENFHPNEVFAVLFAQMVVKDSFGGPGLPRASEAVGKDFAKLRAWAAKHLARAVRAGVR